MHVKGLFCGLVFSAAVSPAPARAQGLDSAKTGVDSANPRAVQPERPTVATHAYTVAPGYVETEAGVQAARPAGGAQLSAPVVVKFGILPRLQAELQGGYAHATNTSGESIAGETDVALVLKQRVLDGAPLLHDFSVQASIKFPTGSRGVTTGTTDVSLLLISSRPIGAAELDLNAGYTRRSGDGASAPVNATLGAASLGGPIHAALGGVAEMFTFPATSGPAGSGTAVGFLFGPTLQLRPWLVLDAGAILNVRNMGANSAYAGFTYNLGRLPGFAPGRRAL